MIELDGPRLTRDEMCMGIAELAARRGTCTRARVGVAIAREGRILVTGYNGAPAGMPHCAHTPDEILANGCTTAVHAECNAIAYAARWGISLESTSLYTTYMSCLPCAQLIINAGIHRVVAKNPYRDRAGLQLLTTANVIVTGTGAIDHENKS